MKSPSVATILSLLLAPISTVAGLCAVPALAIISIPYPILLTSRFLPASSSPLNGKPVTFVNIYNGLYTPVFGRAGAQLPLNFSNQQLTLHNGGEFPVALPVGLEGTAKPVLFLNKENAVKVGGIVLSAMGVYGCEDMPDGTVQQWTEIQALGSGDGAVGESISLPDA